MDCDSRVVADFVFHLKQYRLRSKVTIEDWSTRWALLAEWNQKQDDPDLANPILDLRCDWQMKRLFVDTAKHSIAHISDDPSIYNTLRMIKGIPEGPVELVRNKAIPVEFNLDLMAGSNDPFQISLIQYSRSSQGMLSGPRTDHSHPSSRHDPKTSGSD